MSLRNAAQSAWILPLTTAIAVASAALLIAPALAKPLDADTCQRLKGDVQGLEQQGIRDLMAKGPQIAKSLNAAQLDKIRMLMDLDGQVRFRCGELPTVRLKEEPPEEPQEAGAAPATIDNSTPGITLPPGAESVGAVVPPVKRRPPPPAAAAAKPAAPPQAAGKPAVAPATQPSTPAAKPVATPARVAQPPATEKSKPTPPAPQPPAAAATDAKPAPAAPKAPPAKKIEKTEKKADDAYRPPAPAAKTE